MTTQSGEPDDIEALLPWHAAGTLSAREAGRVDAALAQNPELARRYAMVREELAATVRLNESLGAPSSGSLQRLMRRIAAEPKTGSASRAGFSVPEWWQGLLLRLSPRALAWSAAVAALVILVEAGFLATLFVRGPGETYRTASIEQPAARGTYLLVGFAPQASAAEVTNFLQKYQATIADGPRAGGLYRIKLADRSLSREEVAQTLARMQQESGVVRLAAPTD